jgi:pimeloyl-ACP methyl ester carboxylesterase
MYAAGSNGKPALVMLHAFALDARMWRRQVEALSADHRILLVDLPGFGPQARDLGDVEPANEVARAMDAAKLARAHVVASSFGAAIAMDLALAHPDRVASLVLAGPLLLGSRTDIASWQRCVELASDGDRMTAAEVWLDDPLFDSLRRDEDLFEEVRQIVLDYNGSHWTGRVTNTWLEADPASRLGQLEIPTLVVSGAEDQRSFQAMAEAYARSIPGARREVVAGAGHLVNLDAPDAFNDLVRRFLAPAGAK